MNYTIDDMLKRRPCSGYDRERLEVLWAGRESVSALDILDMDIPDEDKIWGVTRPGLMTARQTDEWLEVVVTRAVTNHALNCGVESVERWAEKWLSAGGRSASAAGYAAWDAWAAARDAAGDAAWAAAGAAAGYAAGAVVGAVRDGAVRDGAVRYAARAAGDAESAEQIADLRAVLERELATTAKQ